MMIPEEIVTKYHITRRIFTDAYVGYNAVQKRFNVYIFPLWMCKSLFITKVDNVPHEERKSVKTNKTYKYKPLYTLPTI